MPKAWLLFAAGMAVMLANRSEGTAQVLTRTPEEGGVGMALVGAAMIPEAVNFRGSGNVMGLPLNTSGRVKLDPGPVIAGIIEYQFDPHFTIQGAFGHSTSDLTRFDGTLTLGPIASKGRFPLNGNTEIWATFINLLCNPFGTGGSFNPFIGAGAGMARPESNIISANLNGSLLPINSKTSENDLALDLLLGANIRVTEKVDIGLFYQRLWINTRHLGSSEVISGSSGRFNANVLGALIEYRL